MLVSRINAETRRRKAQEQDKTLAELADDVRRQCTHLRDFVRMAWPILEPKTKFVHGWVVDAICDHLEAVTDGRIQNLLVNCPPGFSKSLLVCVFWPAWEWGPQGLAHLRYLATSYSQDNVVRDNTRMRDLVESEWYQAHWPSVVMRHDQNAKRKFENTNSGYREGRAFGSLTGGRGDRVLIDDPHSTETAESEAERAEVTRIFRESVPSRVNDADKSSIIIIMQRLHENDVAGQVLSLKLPYVHLRLPMEYEPDTACETSIGFRDPRTAKGELLFPERYSREAVDKLKRTMGAYAVACQFQQRPAPREGGLFLTDRIKVVETLPPGIVRRQRAWDLAATRDGGDFTAGVRMELDSQGRIFVTDVRRVRESPGAVKTLIVATASRDGASCPVRIPQDPAQSGVAQRDDYVRALAGYIVKAVRVDKNKEVRATPLASQIEYGNIFLLRADWNEAFIDELKMFPNGAHDDQVDAAADAFNEMMGVGNETGWLDFAREAMAARAAKSVIAA